MVDVFEQECPRYMAMGMTYHDYWHGDASLPRYYLKASVIKKQMRNEELWLQGKYVYDAIIMASPILHDFIKKGTEPIPYHDAPFPLTEKEARMQRERREKEAFEKQVAEIKAQAEAWNKYFESRR